MSAKQKIVLIGGGGHCRAVIDVIECENRFEIAGIVDKKDALGNVILGYKVLATDQDMERLVLEYTHFAVTVGQIKSNSTRVRLFNLIKSMGGNLPSIVSPRAYVSKHAFIDEGTIVMHDALINANVKIGRNSIINTGAIIEHDSVIGDHCHIATGAYVNGECRVEDHSFVGSCAVLLQGSSIGNSAVVAAGAVIISHVESGSMYAGNPAVLKKRNNA